MNVIELKAPLITNKWKVLKGTEDLNTSIKKGSNYLSVKRQDVEVATTPKVDKVNIEDILYDINIGKTSYYLRIANTEEEIKLIERKSDSFWYKSYVMDISKSECEIKVYHRPFRIRKIQIVLPTDVLKLKAITMSMLLVMHEGRIRSEYM